MGEFEPQGLSSRRRRATSAVSLAGAAVFGASVILMPVSAGAEVIGNPQEEILDDESLLEPMVEDALVIEEDEVALGATDMLRSDLRQTRECRAQFRVTAQQWWMNRSIQN